VLKGNAYLDHDSADIVCRGCETVLLSLHTDLSLHPNIPNASDLGSPRLNPESPFKVTVLPLSDHPDNFTYAITGTADRNWEVGTERFPTAGEAAVAGAAALESWITTSRERAEVN